MRCDCKTRAIAQKGSGSRQHMLPAAWGMQQVDAENMRQQLSLPTNRARSRQRVPHGSQARQQAGILYPYPYPYVAPHDFRLAFRPCRCSPLSVCVRVCVCCSCCQSVGRFGLLRFRKISMCHFRNANMDMIWPQFCVDVGPSASGAPTLLPLPNAAPSATARSSFCRRLSARQLDS